MSSVMKPVGPEEPQVYWRRRALVVAIVLVVLLILFLIFRPKGGDEPQAEPATTSPSPSASASASPQPSGSPSPSASPSASDRLCADTDVKVSVTTSAPSYAAGEEPEITMAIANTGTFPCQRDVGAGANEILVSSGGVQVWSSDDCAPSTDADVQTLQPGKSARVTVTWPRTKSAAGCPSDQPPVPAGAYDAVGRNDKIRSEPVSFTLQ